MISDWFAVQNHQKLQKTCQKLHFVQKIKKLRYYADVNREHHLKKISFENEVRKMVTVATTAIICVAAVMAVAIVCRVFS